MRLPFKASSLTSWLHPGVLFFDLAAEEERNCLASVWPSCYSSRHIETPVLIYCVWVVGSGWIPAHSFLHMHCQENTHVYSTALLLTLTQLHTLKNTRIYGQINNKCTYLYAPNTHTHVQAYTQYSLQVLHMTWLKDQSWKQTFWKSALMPFVSEPPPAEHRCTGTQKKKQESKTGGREQHSPTERRIVLERGSYVSLPWDHLWHDPTCQHRQAQGPHFSEPKCIKLTKQIHCIDFLVLCQGSSFCWPASIYLVYRLKLKRSK